MNTQNKGVEVDPKDVKELFNQNLGRNEIARRLDTTPYYVNKAAKKAGITFNRKATLAAATARTIDALNDRVALAEQFREVARRCLDEALNGNHDPADMKNLLVTAGIAATNDTRLAVLLKDTIPTGSAADWAMATTPEAREELKMQELADLVDML